MSNKFTIYKPISRLFDKRTPKCIKIGGIGRKAIPYLSKDYYWMALEEYDWAGDWAKWTGYSELQDLLDFLASIAKNIPSQKNGEKLYSFDSRMHKFKCCKVQYGDGCYKDPFVYDWDWHDNCWTFMEQYYARNRIDCMPVQLKAA